MLANERSRGGPARLYGNALRRDNRSAYVALAETLECPLVTLDGRLARATGPRCEFRRPSSR